MGYNLSQNAWLARLSLFRIIGALGILFAQIGYCQERGRDTIPSPPEYPPDIEKLLDELPDREFEFVFAAPGDPRLARQIDRVLAVGPKTERVVKPGETLSSIIVQSFGISGGSRSPSSPDYRPNPTNDQRTYDILAREIVELNDLTSPDNIQANQILVIPELPKMAGQTNDVFARGVGTNASRWHEAIYPYVYRGDPFKAGNKRPSLKIQFNEWQTSRNLTTKILEKGAEELPFTASTVVGTFGGKCQQWQDLPPPLLTVSDEDKGVLQQAALDAEKIGNPVTMFVVDSGWPSEESRDSSIDWFNGAADLLWNKYLAHYPKPAWAHVARPSSYSEPTNCHVRLVERAIASVRSSIGSKPPPVDVVYIPLSTDQQSEPFLKALIGIGRALADASGYDDGLPEEGTPKSREARVKAWGSYADKIVKLVKEKIDPNEKRFYMEEWIPVAAIFMGRAISRANGRPYVMNESFWIATKDRPLLQIPSGGFGGLIVAAAGQEGGQAMSTLQPQHAFQAINGFDTIAVMNLDSGGQKNCASNYVDDKYRDDALVVGYSGDIDAGVPPPTTPCANSGTSFSSPRIAWMLALMEGARSDYEPVLFPRRVASAIQASRHKPGSRHPEFNDIRFSASRYWLARSNKYPN